MSTHAYEAARNSLRIGFTAACNIAAHRRCITTAEMHMEFRCVYIRHLVKHVKGCPT